MHVEKQLPFSELQHIRGKDTLACVCTKFASGNVLGGRQRGDARPPKHTKSVWGFVQWDLLSTESSSNSSSLQHKHGSLSAPPLPAQLAAEQPSGRSWRATEGLMKAATGKSGGRRDEKSCTSCWATAGRCCRHWFRRGKGEPKGSGLSRAGPALRIHLSCLNWVTSPPPLE